MSAAIEAINLTYIYPDGAKALDDVTFSISGGECVGIVGPSGAGKSTLAMLLVGFFFPKSGKMIVGGVESNRKNVNEIRKRIGLIFQNPNDQLFMPTVFDDVAFGLLNRGINGDELERRVHQALADRGLDKLAKKFPGHISGGQKRLASLAGVLVMEPETLVLDESSSNLDPKSRRNLITQLAKLKNTRLIIGHDLEMVLDLCSRVIVLSGGRLVADGDPKTVLGNKELMESNDLEIPHSLTPHRNGRHADRLCRE